MRRKKRQNFPVSGRYPEGWPRATRAPLHNRATRARTPKHVPFNTNYMRVGDTSLEIVALPNTRGGGGAISVTTHTSSIYIHILYWVHTTSPFLECIPALVCSNKYICLSYAASRLVLTALTSSPPLSHFLFWPRTKASNQRPQLLG